MNNDNINTNPVVGNQQVTVTIPPVQQTYPPQENYGFAQEDQYHPSVYEETQEQQLGMQQNTQAVYYAAQQKILTWGFQVKIWSIVLLVCFTSFLLKL